MKFARGKQKRTRVEREKRVGSRYKRGNVYAGRCKKGIGPQTGAGAIGYLVLSLQKWGPAIGNHPIDQQLSIIEDLTEVIQRLLVHSKGYCF